MGSQFEPGRAVEVTAPKYGSAYRVGGRLVLTAAHLLGDVGSDCCVRAKQSFGVVAAKVVWKAKNADIALIELPKSAPLCDPVVLGQLPEGKAGEKIAFQMYGYPLWARTKRDEGRSASGGRQIEGIIYLADCSPDGLMVLEAERCPPEVTTAESAWEGVSGGAIVCGGVVIAVQSQHQNPQRPASLEAVPLRMVYADERWGELLRDHGISPELEIAAIPRIFKREAEIQREIEQADASNITSGDRNRSQLASPEFNVYKQEEWVGREKETDGLLKAIKGSCRITVILGITGIGKTTLAERIIDELRSNQGNLLRYDFYDQTSSNKSFIEVAKEWLRKLEENIPVQEHDSESILSLLADKLCNNPYVILIDSLEYILTGNEDVGWGDFLDEAWNKFFLRILSADSCQSRFILTSQDLPSQLRQAGGRYHNFFSYKILKGLEETKQIELFQKQGLKCGEEEQSFLYRIGKAYMGHPLALRVIANEIKIDFHANVVGYWEKFGSEIEEVEKNLAAKDNEGGQDNWKLDSYSRQLRILVKGRVKITFERLKNNAYIAFELICKASVYRRPERETAWLMQLEDDYDTEEVEQALDILKDRSLVEITYDPVRKTDLLGLHNLIRSQALRCRRHNSF